MEEIKFHHNQKKSKIQLGNKYLLASVTFHSKKWLQEKYINEGLSPNEIARICNVCRKTIRSWLKKHGIKTRNRQEAVVRGKEHPHYGKRGKDAPSWGNRHSQETKKTIGEKSLEWHKHNKHPRLGVPHTEETRRKINNAGIGRKQSKETKERRASKLRGRKRPTYSEEWKSNISKAITILWQDPQYRAMMTQIRKDLWKDPNFRQRGIETNRRIASRPEVKQLRSKQMKQQWKNPNFLAKWLRSSQQKPTNPERAFDEITPDIIRYVGNRAWWRKLPNGKYKNPDFKVTGMDRVIEVFGDYWHRNDNPQDLIDLYKQAGLECLVIWEGEIHEHPDQALLKTINFISS